MSKKNATLNTGSTLDPIANRLFEKSMRADAKQNRNKLLKAAHHVFMNEGISASMEKIARHAGVGVGTIYRHFPTKEELIESVMVYHKKRLIEEAFQKIKDRDPGEAFFTYFANVIKEGIANKAIIDAIVISSPSQNQPLEIVEEFWQGVELLFTRAQQNGAVRSDASIEDIRILFTGILQVSGDTGVYPEQVIKILRDGLRSTPQ
ncbi:TetR/AcrR family transcriptional regulator [Paenibacillus massiliensis]|uniref:TetR/AcrR family transcriptional regulator n=1 Tax=Paenibacillus massiliensis TaxID=225917 RepID=UPI00041791FD|nr:TetR/AcrR family transcriptional regulator [Paenibacillus massiliensis]